MSSHDWIANEADLEWVPWGGDNPHYGGWVKRLSVGMAREAEHIGVKLERIPPGKLSCVFHYHVVEDEFFMVLKGRAMLRMGDERIEVKAGDAISCPRGTRVAHQFYNHTDEDMEMLVVGENRANEICHYPDSNKWAVRGARLMGKFEPTDYFTDEPDPPILTRTR